MDLPLSYIFGYLSDELFIERSKRIYATVRLKARFACPNETRRFRPARSSLCPAVRGDADLTYATLQLFQELTPPPHYLAGESNCGGPPSINTLIAQTASPDGTTARRRTSLQEPAGPRAWQGDRA